MYLYSGQVVPVLDFGFHHVIGPGQEEGVAELLVEVSSVGHEGRGEQDISSDGGHLALEGLAAWLPPGTLTAKTGQEGLAALHLDTPDTEYAEMTWTNYHSCSEFTPQNHEFVMHQLLIQPHTAGTHPCCKGKINSLNVSNKMY